MYYTGLATIRMVTYIFSTPEDILEEVDVGGAWFW
jgi:hypothetical protein